MRETTLLAAAGKQKQPMITSRQMAHKNTRCGEACMVFPLAGRLMIERAFTENTNARPKIPYCFTSARMSSFTLMATRSGLKGSGGSSMFSLALREVSQPMRMVRPPVVT